MKIKNDINLQTLAKSAQATNIEKFSEALANAIEEHDLCWFRLDYECYGRTLKDCIKEEKTDVTEYIAILNDAGIAEPTMQDYNTLKNVMIWGEDDCEECGGYLEEIRTTYYKRGADLYAEIHYRCTSCGHDVYEEAIVDQ